MPLYWMARLLPVSGRRTRQSGPGSRPLRQRAGLKDKRLLIVRVDGKATVFEIEQGKQFTLEVTKRARTYREVNFNMETDGDSIA